MAIFIASTKSISRSSGQSAVASASYRAGVELEDKRYGKVHDYSKKLGVMSADIILPTALVDAKVSIERAELWNKAELAETRKDARVAREWLINLPHELSAEDRKEVAHQFAQTLADKYGTIADCAIHRPTDKEIKRGADPRNFHAHIMFTTRTAELDADNKIILTDKATIELSDTKRKTLGLERVSSEIKEVRQIWEHIANDKLAEHNYNLIDSRSYAEQGINIMPQVKMGVNATHLERRTGETSIRGEVNRLIAERNELVWSAEIAANQKVNDAADKIIFEKGRQNDEIEWATGQHERTASVIENMQRAVEWAAKRCENLPKRIDETTQRIDFSERRVAQVTKRVGLSEQWIAANSRRATDSESIAKKISRDTDRPVERIERRSPAFAAPTPFDDNARRARATKLSEQQRRADRDARSYCFSDARVFEHTERMKIVLASKLLARNHDSNRVRWERYETAESYPDKYDRRQADKLDEFAKSLGFEQRPHDYRSNMQEMAKMFTGDFVEQNKPIFDLLMKPAAERERYNNVTNDFDDFKEYIDNKRTEFNDSLVERLGGKGGDVGRMTRDIISSFSYINALDAYISDDNRADEAKEVAKEHRADTISKTCYQFKHALSDVHKLPANEREKHTDALRTSLNAFTEQYSQELSKEAHTAIQSGISSFNYNQDRAVTQSRGLSR